MPVNANINTTKGSIISAAVGDWILQTGTWNDSGAWKDASVWID